MKIKTWIKYEEGYIPPRCRKMRYRECEEYVNTNLQEVELSDMQLAFEDKSYFGKGKIYFYHGKLWCKSKMNDICAGEDDEHGYHTPLEAFIWWKEHSSCYFGNRWDDGVHPDKEVIMKRLRKDMKKYLLVNGKLFQQTPEPRYVINVFGLGHNHGGTGMFCEYRYNPNICKDSYFPATEGEAAVAYANKTAAERGDTKDVGKFKPFIIVHMPELVKVKPNKQHGNGNKFMNDMEKVIKNSDSSAEAGILCAALAMMQI